MAILKSKILSSIIDFTICPYGLPIITTASSVAIFFVESNDKWLTWMPLNDLFLTFMAAYIIKNRWSKISLLLKAKNGFMSRRELTMFFIMLGVKIVAAVVLVALGAVGDNRHEVFENNRLLMMVDRVATDYVELTCWFASSTVSLIAWICLSLIALVVPFSKGSLIVALIIGIQVYWFKWRHWIRERTSKCIQIILASSIPLASLNIYWNAERFGIDQARVLSLIIRRFLYPADVYSDIGNVPHEAIFKTVLSPLIFIEYLTKPFGYDETPMGTVGSVLRASDWSTQTATGGTPYISAHFIFFGTNLGYIIIGLFLCWVSLWLISSLAGQTFWPLLLSIRVLSLPFGYINDYSGMLMSAISTLLIWLLLIIMYALKRRDAHAS